MNSRTVLTIVGAVILAGMIYLLIDTHQDVHHLTDMMEELLAR